MTYPDLQDTKEALDRLAMDRTAQHLIEDRERALADQERLMEQIALESEARGRAEGEAQGRAEGEAQGRAEGEVRGRAEGEAAALRKVIERLCDSTAIDLTPQRHDQLRSASLEELERICESLMALRAWPKD